MNPLTAAKEEIKDNVKLAQEYAVQEYEYRQLKVFYQLTSFTSSIAKKTLIGTFAGIAFIFLSISLAIYIGETTDSAALGFLIVASVYMLIAVSVLLVRKRIEKYIITKIAKKYF